MTLLGSRNQSESIENQSSSIDNTSNSDESFGDTTTDSSNLDEDIPF